MHDRGPEKIGDDVGRGHLILAAPDGRTGDFAQACQAAVGAHAEQQERGFRVRAQTSPDQEFGPNRHFDGNGFNLCDFHATRYLSTTASFTSTPSPGPSGIRTYPSSRRSGSFTSMRLSGPCDVLNSTNAARRWNAARWREAAVSRSLDQE